jgi:HlyD family secretion protein
MGRARGLTARQLVPARSVIERDGRPLLFVVKDGRAQWTYITPGRKSITTTIALWRASASAVADGGCVEIIFRFARSSLGGSIA